MKKKIIIIGLILPLLVSCKENKRIIETESTSVENVEKISSSNNLSNNEKNNSNIKDNKKVKEEEENNEEIDPIFNELEGKTFFTSTLMTDITKVLLLKKMELLILNTLQAK